MSNVFSFITQINRLIHSKRIYNRISISAVINFKEHKAKLLFSKNKMNKIII